MAQDAVAGCIESLKLAGEPIPEEKLPLQVARVTVAV